MSTQLSGVFSLLTLPLLAGMIMFVLIRRPRQAVTWTFIGVMAGVIVYYLADVVLYQPGISVQAGLVWQVVAIQGANLTVLAALSLNFLLRDRRLELWEWALVAFIVVRMVLDAIWLLGLLRPDVPHPCLDLRGLPRISCPPEDRLAVATGALSAASVAVLYVSTTFKAAEPKRQILRRYIVWVVVLIVAGSLSLHILTLLDRYQMGVLPGQPLTLLAALVGLRLFLALEEEETGVRFPELDWRVLAWLVLLIVAVILDLAWDWLSAPVWTLAVLAAGIAGGGAYLINLLARPAAMAQEASARWDPAPSLPISGAPPEEEPLRLFLLGPMRVVRDGETLPNTSEVWRSAKTRSLLAYLALRREAGATQIEIIDALWPSGTDPQAEAEHSSLSALRSYLSTLRRVLDPAGPRGSDRFVVHQGERYGLRPDEVWVDVWQFEALAGQAEALLAQDRWQEGLACWQQAVELYAPEGLLPDESYLPTPSTSSAASPSTARAGCSWPITTTTACRSSPGQHLNGPWGVGVGADGSVYVTENYGYRLLKLDASGAAQWTVGEAGVYGDDNAHLGAWWTGPEGSIAIDRAGRVYVPDKPNNRIQIFNADGSYHATFGSRGNGNYELHGPAGVAIHPVNGDIFVVDHDNQRVQIFTRDWVYRMTLGVLDEQGSDNRHFSWPRGVAVDASGAVYVADQWNDRVQVYDANGAYLATIGGVWGSGNGGLRDAVDVAVDREGHVYVADRANHRVQKFSPGVPGWKQVNVTGFGERWSFQTALTNFGGQLYAGGVQDNAPALWRRDASGDWSSVVAGGLGGTDHWVSYLTEFNGSLYASTGNANGGRIWRSANGVAWTQVNADGFSSPATREVASLASFDGFLYAGTYNETTGGQVWRCSVCNGSDWSQVIGDGFGDNKNLRIAALPVLRGRLYAITNNYSGEGVRVWHLVNSVQCEEDAPAGFGDGNNNGPYLSNSVVVVDNRLDVGSNSASNGAQVWQKTITADFSATPLTCRPPLAVSFSNASAGDVTSTQWDFGNGQTSTAANPTTTYTQAGAYTVRLTVSDGVDSHTVTRPGYVNVWYRNYLPLSASNYDPLNDSYDSSDNPAYDGVRNPLLWSWEGDHPFHAAQQR